MAPRSRPRARRSHDQRQNVLAFPASPNHSNPRTPILRIILEDLSEEIRLLPRQKKRGADPDYQRRMTRIDTFRALLSRATWTSEEVAEIAPRLEALISKTHDPLLGNLLRSTRLAIYPSK